MALGNEPSPVACTPQKGKWHLPNRTRIVSMRLHYYSSVPNFGDDLNRWLWADLFGGALPVNPEITLVGIGTIINGEIPAN